MDFGLFTDQPCKAPCWQKLTPGQSTVEEVDQFLTGLNSEDWSKDRDIISAGGCREINLEYKPESMFNANYAIYIENNKLAFINSMPSIIHPIGLVVARLGDPEYIEAVNAIGPDGSLYILALYYPNRGLAFELFTDEKDVGQINQFMSISDIYYYKPGDMLDFYTARYHCQNQNGDIASFAQDQINRFIRPWTGFGKVNVIETR